MIQFADLMRSEENRDLALDEANQARLCLQRAAISDLAADRDEYLARASIHQQRSLYFTPTQGTA